MSPGSAVSPDELSLQVTWWEGMTKMRASGKLHLPVRWFIGRSHVGFGPPEQPTPTQDLAGAGDGQTSWGAWAVGATGLPGG